MKKGRVRIGKITYTYGDGTYLVTEQRYNAAGNAWEDCPAAAGAVTATMTDISESTKGAVDDIVQFWWAHGLAGKSLFVCDVIGRGDGAAPGFIRAYGGNTVPAGYLLCDGTQYLQADYAALYAAIGDLWARDGDPPDPYYFQVPLLGGMALRGWADGGSAVGTTGGILTLDLIHQHGPTYGICAPNTELYESAWDFNSLSDVPEVYGDRWLGGSNNAPTIDSPNASHQIDNRGPFALVKWCIKT